METVRTEINSDILNDTNTIHHVRARLLEVVRRLQLAEDSCRRAAVANDTKPVRGADVTGTYDDDVALTEMACVAGAVVLSMTELEDLLTILLEPTDPSSPEYVCHCNADVRPVVRSDVKTRLVKALDELWNTLENDVAQDTFDGVAYDDGLFLIATLIQTFGCEKLAETWAALSDSIDEETVKGLRLAQSKCLDMLTCVAELD